MGYLQRIKQGYDDITITHLTKSWILNCLIVFVIVIQYKKQ